MSSLIKPWNFPTYRACGSYNFAYDGDPYYSPNNGIADFADNGNITIICAVLLPPGFSMSGLNQNTSGTGSSYPPIMGLSRYGENDANYMIRGYHNGTGSTANTGLQFFMYDGNASGYEAVMSVSFSAMRAAGIYLGEGQMLQVALSVEASTGKKLMYINGIQVWSASEAAWSSTGMHRSANARMTLHAYPNWSTTTFSSGGTGNEMIYGPMLVDDAFHDLSDVNVRDKIYDANGDFLWAGQNGSAWLNGTIPWYFSEYGVPYDGNRGSSTVTFSRVSSSSYARWGHPCGSKWDWPNDAPEYIKHTVDNRPLLKGLWPLGMFMDEANYFLYNPYTADGHIKNYSTSYGPIPAPPHRHGEPGSFGSFFTTSGGHGYRDYNTALDSVVQNVETVWLTMCLDFSLEPTNNFGFLKVAGWRDSSSSSALGAYFVYPNNSGRNVVLQYYGTDGVARYFGYPGGVPQGKGVTAITWYFHQGVMKYYIDQNAPNTQNYSGSFTRLRNSTPGSFGFFDYTSSQSGSSDISMSYLAIGNDQLTDQNVWDLHALLLNGATS